MAELVSTNEVESDWEWLNDVGRWTGKALNNAVNVYGEVEKVKAQNPQPTSATNTASPAKTVTEAVQTPQTVPEDKTKMYAAGAAAFVLFVLVLIFALRGKR